jgi:uncharacterized membrane-anchored protein YhcB (DUF1043 family)
MTFTLPIVRVIELIFIQRWSGISDMTNFIILLVLFVAGGLVGFAIYHFTLGKKQSGTQRKELEQTKAELDQYKAKVNSHFKDSAALMGQVASSYQALHSHMANQSQSLISDDNNAVFPQLNATLPESQDGSLLSTDSEHKTPVDVALEANNSSETSQVNDAESEVSNDKNDYKDDDKADSNAEDFGDSNANAKTERNVDDEAESNADNKTNERSVDHNDKKPDQS